MRLLVFESALARQMFHLTIRAPRTFASVRLRTGGAGGFFVGSTGSI